MPQASRAEARYRCAVDPRGAGRNVGTRGITYRQPPSGRGCTSVTQSPGFSAVRSCRLRWESAEHDDFHVRQRGPPAVAYPDPAAGRPARSACVGPSTVNVHPVNFVEWHALLDALARCRRPAQRPQPDRRRTSCACPDDAGSLRCVRCARCSAAHSRTSTPDRAPTRRRLDTVSGSVGLGVIRASSGGHWNCARAR